MKVRVIGEGSFAKAVIEMAEDICEVVEGGEEILVSANNKKFIDIKETPCIGYHPSLLPLHRGGDAVRWAIHMRERVTGGTVFWLDSGCDTGDIILQDFCFIRPDDTASSLWRRELFPMGVRLLRKSILLISKGVRVRVKQDEALATWEPSFDRPRLGAP